MSLVDQYNMGYRVKGRTAFVGASITQTSNAAATTQDGITIDRLASGLRRYYSCKAIVHGNFLYGASSAHTASVSINVQHSSDGTSWDSYSTGTVPTAVVFGASSSGWTGGDTTAGLSYGTVEQSVNLRMARRYIRIQIPAPTYTDCSSGQYVTLSGIVVFGGADELPVDTAGY